MKNIDFFGGAKRKKPFKFKPVKLPTKQSVRKIKKKNLTWPQAQVKYPKLKPFADADRDGKLNMFDCKPFNKNKHGWIRAGPNKGKYKVHSLRPYKEAYMKKAYPADTQSNMSYGRDSGYFGTGIYGFKSKRLAKKNQVIPSKMKDNWEAHSQGARVIRSYNIEKPLILNKEQSRTLHNKSKALNKMYYGEYKYEDDKPISRIILAQQLEEAGIDNVSASDVKLATRRNRRKPLNQQDQPITRLLKAKGYGGVIPHEDYQNFGYGSVVHIDPEGVEPEPLTEKEKVEKEILRKKLRENEDYNMEIKRKRTAEHRPKSVYSINEDGERVEEGFLDSDDNKIKEALEAYDVDTSDQYEDY